MPGAVIGAIAANAVAGFAVSAGWGALAGAALGAIASMSVGAIFQGAFGSKARAAEPSFDTQMRDRLVTVRQPIPPWQVIYGQPRVGGALTYWETTNSNNRLHLVITFACHRVEEITSIYFDGEEVPLDADGYATGRYAGYVRIKKNLGDPAETGQPFPDLVTQSAGKWTTAYHLQRGHSKIWVQLDWNNNLFPNGIPNITALIKGARVYDTRTNTTAWSANAALCMADYWTNTRYGYGADDTEELNDDQLVAAANIADEAVPLDAGGTEARYTTHGSFKLNTKRREIIEQLITPLGAPSRYIGGQLFVHAGEYSAPTITLDEGDLRGSCEVSVLVPESEAANGVKGVYTSPDNAWQPSDYPPVASSTFMTQDGGERIWKEINLPFTISAAAAQRLAKIELLRARQQLTVQAEFKLTAYRLKPGDFVAFTYSAWGMTAKAFEVMTANLVFIPDENGFFRLGVDATLRETAADVWDWDASEETAVDPAPNTNMPSAFTVQPPGTPSVVETIYKTTGSAGVKTRATASWAAAPGAVVATYEAQYRPQGATDWLSLSPVSLLTAEKDDLSPGFYEFRVRAVNSIGVRSNWSVTTTKEFIGLTAPPSDPTGFAVQAYAGQGKAVWNRSSPETDLDVLIGGRAWIRHSPATAGAAWTDGTLVNKDGFPGDAASAPVPLLTGTYMIKFSDSSGNYSANMASFSVTEALLTSLTTLATLTEHSAFAGAKTNTYVDGGELKLGGAVNWDSIPGNIDTWGYVDYAGGVSSTGTYAFATKMDLGSAKNFRLIASLTSNAFDTGDTWDDRTDNIDDWGLVDGGDVEDAEVQVMVRITTDDPASGGATWGPWHPLSIAGDYYARGVDARLDFTSGSVTHNRRVTALTLTAKQ